ncbi:MAG: hypothetical protein AMXMBFR48_15130 [Ignavibacteriales bacterium]|jgi:NAD(P)H-dependent FMN reductase
MTVYKVALLAGTMGENREGLKVLQFAKNQVLQRGWEPLVADAGVYQLPLLSEVYRYMKDPSPQLTEIHEILTAADGFIVITAEYNHGIPPALKNMLDYFRNEYFFKPSGIISYSTGPFGGVRGAEQLRLVLSELRTPPIPTSIPVSRVQDSLLADGSSVNGDYERRSKKFFDELGWYMEALAEQRKKGIPY